MQIQRQNIPIMGFRGVNWGFRAENYHFSGENPSFRGFP